MTRPSAPGNGTIRVVDASGKSLLEHKVEEGDIWRMCQVKDAPIRDWVKLAVTRARATGAPAIFWLNKDRAHDAQLITKVNQYFKRTRYERLDLNHDAGGCDALLAGADQGRQGHDLRNRKRVPGANCMTDLPDLKMEPTKCSDRAVLNGGGLFETGAGGSAAEAPGSTVPRKRAICGGIRSANSLRWQLRWSI